MTSLLDPVQPYDETYYERFEGDGDYDVLRPVRKSLTLRTPMLPDDARVVVFAIGNVSVYRRWRKRFAQVSGYDVNPAVLRHGTERGIAEHLALQDVSVPFVPRFRGHLAVCYYLLEHLSDEGCVGVVRNMMRAAPLNIIMLTPGDDDRYTADPTHCNAKTASEWARLLRRAYAAEGWARVWADGPRWCYASPQAKRVLDSMQASVRARVNTLWRAVDLEGAA